MTETKDRPKLQEIGKTDVWSREYEEIDGSTLAHVLRYIIVTQQMEIGKHLKQIAGHLSDSDVEAFLSRYLELSEKLGKPFQVANIRAEKERFEKWKAGVEWLKSEVEKELQLDLDSDAKAKMN